METTLTTSSKNLKQFFLFSFFFSWFVWIGMIIFEPAEQLFIPLLFLGAFGPSLGACLLIAFSSDPAQKKDFWKRLLGFKRVSLKNYLFIFLIFPLILSVGYGCMNFFGMEIPSFSSFFEGIDSISGFLYLLLFMLLGGPLAEELGWRGFALQPLQEKLGPLKASLLLGSIWILWHLPLFFIEGTSQNQKGFGISFWSWSLQLLLISIIFTWVYNNTRRSILAAVLLHLMANFFYPSNLDWSGELIFTGVRILIVLPILLQWNNQKILQTKAPKTLA
ncbi:MAG: CPBP family intramembrane glutamic endopeptidase [Salinimicrobium sp.]